jgi:hypothetical protein
MTMNKIKFISNRPWLSKKSTSCPEPIIKTIPDWFRKADRFFVDPNTGKHWVNPQDGGKVPTWKACPAIFDIMGTGYTLKTPCDIEFYIDEGGKIAAKILDPMYQDFVGLRLPLPQFKHPEGYYQEHFVLWADWGREFPKGF